MLLIRKETSVEAFREHLGIGLTVQYKGFRVQFVQPNYMSSANLTQLMHYLDNAKNIYIYIYIYEILYVRYSIYSEGRWFDSRWCHCNFSST
jgi:hypothetical protein